MSAELTDEDVLNINNIILLFSHLSPTFHNKAILSFTYSLASEHPHPPQAVPLLLLGEGFFTRYFLFRLRSFASFNDLSREGNYAIIPTEHPHPPASQVPSPTWRRLFCALLSLSGWSFLHSRERKRTYRTKYIARQYIAFAIGKISLRA